MITDDDDADPEYGAVMAEDRKIYGAIANDKLARSKKVLNRLYNIKVQF